KATLSQVPGLGDGAFAALQVPSAGGDTTNLLTVVGRYRNVLITVVAQGPAKPRRGYAAGSPAHPQAAAVAAARDGLGQMPREAGAGHETGRRPPAHDLRWAIVLLLAFDTATPAVTVAVHDGARVLAHATTVDARRQGELLASHIEKVLARAGVSLAELTAIVAGVG